MGNVFDQMAGQPQSNQPVAQKPPVEIPQPVAPGNTDTVERASVGGIPVTMGGGMTQDKLDSIVRPPASNVFDQMAATKPQQQTHTNPTTGNEQAEPEKSDTMNWLKKVWGHVSVGDMIPEAATRPLAFATHDIIEPYEQSVAWAGKKTGELAERVMAAYTPYTVEQAREKFPKTYGLTGAAFETAGSTLADPRNWPLMAGKFAKPILNRLMSGAFATQMGSGVKDQAQQLAENWDNMSPYDRWHAVGQIGLGSAMTVAAATHAASGSTEAKIASKPERGTVEGDRTTLRPTTVKTAGVEAPIPAIKQENPNVFTKMATKLGAEAGKLAEFQKEQTKPAATRQAVSALSQVATDKIAAHDALANGEAAPDPITGTQIAGEHATPDRIWDEMQNSANQTWEKARQVSASETEAWERERVAAEKSHQDGIDHYNELVSNHNADPANAGNQMQPQSFNPDDVNLRDKPKTYDELKSDVDAAKDKLTSDDTDVRQKAKDVEVPKAEKALDKWFADHDAHVSKGEYESAKQLWADSERFKEIANNLRSKLAKETLTANDIRGLEAVIDGKAIKRRGAAGIGEFKRLLGPEAYDNLQNVSKLFEPFEANSPLVQFKSWGMAAIKSILAGGLGYEYGGTLGAAASEGAGYLFHKLVNRILFDPTLGSSFVKFVELTKNAVSNGTRVSQDAVNDMKMRLKDLWQDQTGEAKVPGTGRKSMTPTFDMDENGKDEQGDPNHIMSIKHDDKVVGHLNVSQRTPDSWTINDSVIRPDMQRNGFGTAAYAEAFRRAAEKRMATVESDISTTQAAARTWRALMKKFPGAITEENGQFTADLSKMGFTGTSIAAGADAYNAAEGRPAIKHEAMQPDARRAEIADAFDAMKHDPNDPKVKASYAALKEDIKKQWDFATKKLGIKIEPSDQDPYGFSGSGKPAEDTLFDDVEQNKHLGVWRGGNPLEEGHPLGEVDPETGETYNTMLRAVHDVFGHVAAKNRFGEAGEESAWGLHKQMFSPAAVPAMTTETRGQTSWFFNNAGVRGGEEIGKFAQQKAGLLPEFAHIRSAEFDKLSKATRDNGGFTFNPNKGDMAGKAAFAVAGSYPKLSVEIEGLPSAEMLKEYASNPKVQEVLKQNPDASIGAWSSNGKTHVEISETPSNREQAIALGKKNNQESIWDLQKGEEIPTGGTGTNVAPANFDASEITTRRPKAVGSDLSNKPGQHPNMDAIEQAGRNNPSGTTAAGKPKMGYKEKLARTVADYTGIPFTDEDRANPDRVLSKFVNHVADNLEWLYNQVPEEIRGRTRQWYDSAHTLIENKAKAHGFSLEQGAGVTAALSPQNPWDNNLALADRMMDIYHNRQNFKYSPAMEQTAAELKKVPTQSKAFKGLLRDIAGKKLKDVKNSNPDVQAVQRALWIRLYDEAHGSTTNDQYSPTGEVVGHSPDMRSWIGLDHASKAVKILENGSVENINAVMGQGHKIRNFYNNIINPMSKAGHTTIDTHAVAAGLLTPVGPKDTEAAHNFGGTPVGIPGAPKDASTGLQGTYPLYTEAYQRTARKLGILPRELQSVTWEAIKSLMGDDKKTPELKKNVRQIWEDVQAGRLTPEDAREKIKDAAKGFLKPAWMSEEDWEKVGPEGDASFDTGQLQTVSLNGETHGMTADVHPPVDSALKGTPRPTVPTVNPEPHQLSEYADWANANTQPEEILRITAHELSHAFLQHHFGVPTAKLKIGLGHRAVFEGQSLGEGLGASPTTGIAGGFLNPGDGWHKAIHNAKTPDETTELLQKYTTQLMAGRAMEELLGTDPDTVKRHASGDVKGVRENLIAMGVPKDSIDGLLEDSTERAKQILRDNWSTMQHMSRQAVNHYGSDLIDSGTFHKYRNGGVHGQP